VCGAEW